MEKTIKQRLVEAIIQSGMSTVELAKKTGVSANMISQYKNTNKMPSIETFALLCKALGISSDYILGISKEL